jgi:hypothetical protein
MKPILFGLTVSGIGAGYASAGTNWPLFMFWCFAVALMFGVAEYLHREAVEEVWSLERALSVRTRCVEAVERELSGDKS